jgi:hypothetical protein
LKRLALEAGFTEEQCWGPSEKRAETIGFDVFDENWDKPYGEPVKVEWLEDVGLSGEYLQDLNDWATESMPYGQTVSARHFLQRLGTEFGRVVKPSIWVDAGINTSLELLGGGRTYYRNRGLMLAARTYKAPNFVVITDGRFRNEVLGTKKVGGMVIKVVDMDRHLADSHASEAEQDSIPNSWFDIVFYNDKDRGLGELEYNVNTLLLPKVVRPAVSCG